MDGQPGLLGDELVETAEQGASAGEDDAAVDQIGGEFGRAAFESRADRLDDPCHGFRECLADLLRGDGDGLGKTGNLIPSLHIHRHLLL